MTVASPSTPAPRTHPRGFRGVASLAGALIDWSDRTGSRLTPEHIADVSCAHLVIFADDLIRRGEGGVVGLVRQAQLKAALREAGWCCLTVFVNAETGSVKISVERRGRDRGMKLTIMRSTWTTPVHQMRDLTVRESGFARDFWSIDLSDAGTGCRVVHEDLEDAIASMASRICEDSPQISPALVQFALESAT